TPTNLFVIYYLLELNNGKILNSEIGHNIFNIIKSFKLTSIVA
ncbi:hypothetical protein C5S42_00435, partial [Candidatus Methanomarinus sp.]